jgi:hypothetical protein
MLGAYHISETLRVKRETTIKVESHLRRLKSFNVMVLGFFLLVCFACMIFICANRAGTTNNLGPNPLSEK